jgi:hypothetical protein
VIAAAGLAVAAGWRAAVFHADIRHVERTQPGARAYRPGLGWTSPGELRLRLRWARVGLIAAAGVAASLAVAPTAELLRPAAATVIAIWLVPIARQRHGNYTSLCIATLAVAVALASVSIAAAGLLASIAAAQLYLVAGIRKLRSPDFMTGRVLLDTVAYAVCQASAGNREFLTIVGPARLATALERGTLLRVCRVVAVATVAVELAVGVGAAGLLPVAVTFALAIPMHAGFLALGPKRLLPFTAASLGLLALATVHPLF